MLMTKHKATFLVDKDDWVLFQNWAAIQGSTATNKLCEFIRSVARDELPEDYKQQIEDRVQQKLNEFIDDSTIDAIAFRVAPLLGMLIDTADTVDTVDVKTVDYTPDTADTPHTALLGDTVDTPDTANNSLVKDEKLISDRSKTQLQDSRSPAPAKVEKAGDRNKRSLNSRTYSDAEVGSSESLSQTSVCRYRTGNRQPKDLTFWERWQVCDWNDKRWVKV